MTAMNIAQPATAVTNPAVWVTRVGGQRWCGHGKVRPMRITGIVLALGLLLSGCAGTEDNAATDDSAEQSSKPKAEDTPTEEADDDCLPVSPEMAKAIANGREDGTGLKATGKAAAVKSPDYSKVYFIAVEFTAPGIDKEAGVWASNSLKPGGGIIMSADAIAQESTVWPDGDKTDAQISIADPSVDAALACL